MTKTFIAVIAIAGGAAVWTNTSRSVHAAEPSLQVTAAAPSAVDPVVLWNRTLLTIVRTPKAQPATVHPTRSFAIMHAAIYDAVDAIVRTHKPYAVTLADVPRHASVDAAADAAAHDVLVALYPAFTATLDAQLQNELAAIAAGADVADGVQVGQTVAARLLALRSNDGSKAAPIPYTFGTHLGDYQSTPPNFPPQPQFTHWSGVKPFVLPRANVFRPGPPPALNTDRYGDDFNNVKAFGMAGGTTAKSDQMLAGRFWNGAIQNYWNEIAQTASDARHLTTPERARLFALLNLTIADSVIAFYDAKYTYNFWRPVTAIRGANAVNNPDTVGDPTWLPLVGNTPPDPSYPGAHAVVSGAALDVLLSVLKHDRLDLTVTSEALPGVTRHFDSLSDAAAEATASRVFAGVHFRFDLTSGRRLGREVAAFAVDHVLTRADDDDDRR